MPSVATKTKKNSYRRACWALAAVAVVSCVGYIGYRRLAGPIVPVVQLTPSRVVQRLVASGRVIAPFHVNIGSVAVGRIASVFVHEGDHVTQGQQLLLLEDAEARASVAQAQAGVKHAQAILSQVTGVKASVAEQMLRQAEVRYDQANEDFEREKSLFSAGASTQQKLNDARKAVDLAHSSLRSAKAQAADYQAAGADRRVAGAALAQARAGLDLATSRLEQTRILCPTDAIVVKRMVEPGDVVQPGKTLLIIASDKPLQITVPIDEKNLSLLHVGQHAWVSADAYPTDVFDGTIQFISPIVDTATGTVEVKLSVQKPPSYWLSDMSVSVSVDGAPRDGVYLVPGGSIGMDSSHNPYVMVVQGGRVQSRLVKLGIVHDEMREVISGLEQGDRVITNVDLAKDGKRVRTRVMASTQAAQATQGAAR